MDWAFVWFVAWAWLAMMLVTRDTQATKGPLFTVLGSFGLGILCAWIVYAAGHVSIGWK
jgi:hypothetical protein